MHSFCIDQFYALRDFSGGAPESTIQTTMSNICLWKKPAPFLVLTLENPPEFGTLEKVQMSIRHVPGKALAGSSGTAVLNRSKPAWLHCRCQEPNLF